MISTTAIFDIGKTNKKFLLFNDQFEIVYELQVNFDEIADEDGEPCEDLKALTSWMLQTWKNIEQDQRFEITALNFTTYGASFVHLDQNGRPVTPLYNYLKKFPSSLEKTFFDKYGSQIDISTVTASPYLGMLNSGLQIYWLKYEHPTIFSKIATSLHFPQYCAWLFTGKLTTDYTSVGCHTMLWNFATNSYHDWVYAEGIDKLLLPIGREYQSGTTQFRSNTIPVGTGLHDSSSALIPYITKFEKEFLLLSTGTWCVTLNPFAKKILDQKELLQDCLNFLSFQGSTVKASRLFIGNAHENMTKRFAAHFFTDKDYYKNVLFSDVTLQSNLNKPTLIQDYYNSKIQFSAPDLDQFETYEDAYHKLIWDMVQQQIISITLAAEGNLTNKRLFIDGGFSKNVIFISLLKQLLPSVKIEFVEFSQGTALGAAMVMQQNELANNSKSIVT